MKKNYDIIILLAVGLISFLLLVVLKQDSQINQLEKELEMEKIKYEIISHDPLTQDTMQAGG